MSNAELARRVGVPEATCSGRWRVLRERGVIAGVHADVDLGSLDVPPRGHDRAALHGPHT